jgi:hypothetical protein
MEELDNQAVWRLANVEACIEPRKRRRLIRLTPSVSTVPEHAV